MRKHCISCSKRIKQNEFRYKAMGNYCDACDLEAERMGKNNINNGQRKRIIALLQGF